MAGIQHIGKGFDAFADAEEDTGDNTKVHIRVQQRNGRKCITTVQGCLLYTSPSPRDRG